MIYLNLFWTFLKIGAFTFGGGYAMIPLIQQEVLKNEWLSAQELIDFIAISESTPGPFAVNASTFVGMRTAGIAGAFVATLGVVLPSFIIILIVARMYEKFRKSKAVVGAMLGLRGAVVGLIGTAILTTVNAAMGAYIRVFDIKEIVTAVVLFIAVFIGLMKKINPILLIVLSGFVGIIVNI